MKIYVLLVLSALIAGCSARSINMQNSASPGCSGYTVAKINVDADSVRLDVDYKACVDDYKIPAMIMVRDKNRQLTQYHADINGQVKIVLKEGEYEIMAMAMGFKPLKIPQRRYRSGHYKVNFNVRDEDEPLHENIL